MFSELSKRVKLNLEAERFYTEVFLEDGRATWTYVVLVEPGVIRRKGKKGRAMANAGRTKNIPNWTS
jgi:hypothetical protein